MPVVEPLQIIREALWQVLDRVPSHIPPAEAWLVIAISYHSLPTKRPGRNIVSDWEITKQQEGARFGNSL